MTGARRSALTKAGSVSFD